MQQPSVELTSGSLIANVRQKLKRLQAQIEVVGGSEYPNKDSKQAVVELETTVVKAISRISSIENYSPQVQERLLTESNRIVLMLTELLGFVVRSTANRNLFELYFPFIEDARRLLTPDVRLVLSSDWRYSPFTYPYGLDELPNYVLIGLPASESENSLVFPTAGHELGHNIWRARKLADAMAADLQEEIYRAYEARVSEFNTVFPDTVGANIRNDMFVQRILSRSAAMVSRQMEELFCDFIGLLMFGASYLFAFDYVVAPSLGGKRDGFYPAIRRRAELLSEYGKKCGFEIKDYVARFSDGKLPAVKEMDFMIERADDVLTSLAPKLFALADNIVKGALGSTLSQKDQKFVEACFRNGVPCPRPTTLGNLLNAAWSVYNDKADHEWRAAYGVEKIPFLTDLVVKSAETLEYKSF